jgi:phenylpropionate dioxygenase-like ring-hydroxylating dioxygenase large terminal subunit
MRSNDPARESLRVSSWEEGPRGLPPACYTSPEFYARETDRIFRRDWLCIGRADEVAEPGDYLSLELFGEPLVMVRDGAGEVRVLSRICRHRAMPVVSGAGHARTFVCPYHTWTYALDGRLLGAPEMSKTPGFAPADCSLPSLRSEVWEGFVFVSFDPQAPALGPSLAGLAGLFQNYDLAGLKTVRRVVFDMDCGWNWKLMCENFMEPYHHIGTHRQSLEPLMPARRSVTLEPDGPYAVVHMRYREGDRSTEHERWGAAALPVVERLSEEERNRATLIHIFPTGLLTLLPDHVEFYRLAPEGPSRVRLEKLICVSPEAGARATLEAELAQIVKGFLTIRDEDVAICRAVQEGLGSRFAEPGRLCHLERAIWQFARYVATRVADVAPKRRRHGRDRFGDVG